MEIVTPRPSSSLLLLRDTERGLQVYTLRRSRESKFMANARVFPGGTLDEADAAPEMAALCHGLSGVEAWFPEGFAENALDIGRPGRDSLVAAVTALNQTVKEIGDLKGADRGPPSRGAWPGTPPASC